jgi:hypothetical protein
MIAMRTLIWILLAGLTASGQFLVGDQSYRCPASETGCKGLHAFERGSGYTINYAEYRDSGMPFKPRELQDALDQIEAARQANGWAAVVVYVHGWKNNANERYDNVNDVVRFRAAMVRLARQYAPGNSSQTPPLVGIYLAWRVLTLTVEPFKTMSYWPRRYFGRKIGQSGMHDAMRQIVDKVGEHRDQYRLFFVGRSFGARVLENAADGVDTRRPGFMRNHRVQVATKAVSAESLPPADLIAYVNAATASTVTRKTVDHLTMLCGKPETSASPVCNARPFYLAVTSTADLATGVILPVANLVFPALTSDGLHLLSAANTPWLHTHTVVEVRCPLESGLPTPFRCDADKDKDFCSDAFRDTRACYEVRRVNPGVTPGPFWIMNVNGQVIKDHGDVWNENLLNMLSSILHLNGKEGQPPGTQQVPPPG